MAPAVRRQLSALIRDLTDDAAPFEYFQAVRLVETAAAASGSGRGGPGEVVGLRTAADLSFPAADVRRASIGKDGRVVLESAFLGLYGVDAPLPAYFRESVAHEGEAGQCLRSFLDLFGGRFYELLYLAWKKNRAHLFDDNAANPLEDYLLSLSGVVQGERGDLAMAYSGVFGRRIKGATALAGMLRDRLGVAARIEEFVPCWVETGAVSSLGRSGMTLGDDALLGERVLDVGRKINIRVGPLSEDRMLDLLPLGNGAGDLRDIVNGYLEPALEYDVIFELECASSERRLGSDPVHLGWTSSLGRSTAALRRIRLAGSAYKG